MIHPNSPAVLMKAETIIASQAFVPKSPALRGAEGSINLCLAAAVAKAGFVVQGRSVEARNLEEQLALTQSKILLEEAFAVLGWPIEDCRMKLAFNDSKNDKERKERVLSYLRSLLPQHEATA